MKLQTVAAGGVAILSGVVSAQGFLGSCSEAWFASTSTPWLYARCDSISKEKVLSRIDLNQCIGNDNGVLVSRTKGNFKGSCNSCVADDLTNVSDPENPVIGDITINLPVQGTNLTCSCREKDGDQRIGTSINLNTVVGNDNGVLKCFDNYGQKFD